MVPYRAPCAEEEPGGFPGLPSTSKASSVPEMQTISSDTWSPSATTSTPGIRSSTCAAARRESTKRWRPPSNK